MKRKWIPIILVVILAIIASAVLYALRPLGYTVSDGLTKVRPAPMPQQPLTGLTVGNAQYRIQLSESFYNDADVIIDEYRVIDGDAYDADDGMDDYRKIRVVRQTASVVSFRYVQPYPPLQDYRQRSDEENKAAIMALFEEYDFSVYDSFEIWGEPLTKARNYRWFSAQTACSLSVRVTADGIIDDFIVYDQAPAMSDRLPLNESECQRLVRRYLMFNGMISPFRGYEITFKSRRHTLSDGKPAIACSVCVTDEDGFVFVVAAVIQKS